MQLSLTKVFDTGVTVPQSLSSRNLSFYFFSFILLYFFFFFFQESSNLDSSSSSSCCCVEYDLARFVCANQSCIGVMVGRLNIHRGAKYLEAMLPSRRRQTREGNGIRQDRIIHGPVISRGARNVRRRYGSTGNYHSFSLSLSLSCSYFWPRRREA